MTSPALCTVVGWLCCLCLTPTTQPSERPAIHEMTNRQVAERLPAWQREEPDLARRFVSIARRNLGQPYEIYLLGEAPFEQTDPQPVYCIGKSDCVVFVEHSLAMALSDDFPTFLAMLQRIRYRDGAVGVLTRNHYTEADWNRNNRWLLRDITDEVGGAAAVRWTQKVDRAKFFRERYKLETAIAVQEIGESFIPHDRVAEIASGLREGDVVNFVSGRGGNYWVGHVGLLGRSPEGELTLIHSAAPQVREEPIGEYVARATANADARRADGKSTFAGFKFLRLTADPWAELRRIDGPAAPKVTLPADSPVSWEAFVAAESAR